MRRFFLVLSVIALSLSISSAESTAPISLAPEYRLRLFNVHTSRWLDIVYRRGESYIPEALEQLDDYLKDHSTGDIHRYDPRVFDLLHDLENRVGHANSEIDVVCGYRSPWRNEFLRRHNHRVARHSLHMQAMAIDIRIPGVSTERLRDAALSLHRGGVAIMLALPSST